MYEWQEITLENRIKIPLYIWDCQCYCLPPPTSPQRKAQPFNKNKIQKLMDYLPSRCSEVLSSILNGGGYFFKLDIGLTPNLFAYSSGRAPVCVFSGFNMCILRELQMRRPCLVVYHWIKFSTATLSCTSETWLDVFWEYISFRIPNVQVQRICHLKCHLTSSFMLRHGYMHNF